jgi:geranylgeranyl diphosphate synthase type II
LAVTRALGGYAEAAVPTATAIELFHNAFLIHDDVEDEASVRRRGPTLFSAAGAAAAINVGDAMLALALEPLLDNTRTVGLGRALALLELVARMARETTEGQAIELDWIHRRAWMVEDRDYLRMIHKKSGWYTFVTPMRAGVILAGASRRLDRSLGAVAAALGVAFQIQDDVLSLTAGESLTGKDRLGDLWEGKRTLPLLHLARALSEGERAELDADLDLARRVTSRRFGAESELVQAAIEDAWRRGLLTEAARDLVLAEISTEGARERARAKVVALARALRDRGSVDHARRVAGRHADAARRWFGRVRPELTASVHADFLATTIEYVCERLR